MKKHSLIYTSLTAAFCVFLSFCAISCQQNDDFDIQRGEDGYITLRLSCSDMLPTYEDPMDKILGTRAATQKTDDEKTINSLHLFFFNADGNFATLQDPDDQINAPYVRFYPASNEQTIRIPKGCFKETQLTVVALANIQGQAPTLKAVFKTPSTLATAEGESFVRTLNVTNETDEYGAFTTTEIEINNLDDLKAWIYAPAERDRVRDLPVGGMPMMSDPVEITNTDQASLQRITMKAMMARVEVNIRLEPNQTSRDGRLPILKIASYGVENMAATVPYIQPATTALAYGNIRETKTVEDPHEVAANTTGEDQVIRLVYYTYENIQGEHQKETYPDGVTTEAEMQRWKPIVAKENEIDDKATRIVINGEYTTHQNFTYKAKFSIYLGGNTTTDFSVKRNHCYTNNVVIHGLDYVRNDDDGVYTFDGRVNVVDENNVWYMSIVNERKVDAHASVLPMDIYLVLREGTYKGTENLEHPKWSEVTMEIIDDATGEPCDWIGFEMIPYPGENGMIKDELTKQNSDGSFTFVAGTKAKDYFYYDLVSAAIDEQTGANKYNLRKKGIYRIQENEDGTNTSSYLVNGEDRYKTDGHIEGVYSRMRIYFYIDENVPTGISDAITPDNVNKAVPARHATINLTYKNSNNVERERKIEIDQTGLLLVAAKHGQNDDWTYMYIETYEEYLEHSDPLEYHTSPEVFRGLQWGPNGSVGRIYSHQWGLTGISNENTYSYENYHHGRNGTQTALSQLGIADMSKVKLYNRESDFVEHELYALNYCYGKNKRNEDGSVYTGGLGLWELPGIRDLEVALVQYYSVFPEFQDHDYWSSAAGKNGNNEITTTARATRVTYNGSGYTYQESASGDLGNKNRLSTNIADRQIRIRAAYKTTCQEKRKLVRYNALTNSAAWSQVNGTQTPQNEN